MQEWEVWIDLEVPLSSGKEVICGLFARMSFPVRPSIGERITFHAPQGSEHVFMLSMSWGPMQSSSVSCVVDDITHSRVSQGEGGGFTTALRFEALPVATISDAGKVLQFLANHHGFEIDPYGVNKLVPEIG